MVYSKLNHLYNSNIMKNILISINSTIVSPPFQDLFRIFDFIRKDLLDPKKSNFFKIFLIFI